jgi:hypothetical protein
VDSKVPSTEEKAKFRLSKKLKQNLGRYLAISSQLIFLVVCLALFFVLFYPFASINTTLGNLTLDLRWISYPIAFIGLYISVGWIAYTFIGQLPIGKRPKPKKFNPHGPLISVLIAARNE